MEDGTSFDDSGNFLPARANQDDIDVAKLLVRGFFNEETSIAKKEMNANAADVAVPNQAPCAPLRAETSHRQTREETYSTVAACVTPDKEKTKKRGHEKDFAAQQDVRTSTCPAQAPKEGSLDTEASLDTAATSPACESVDLSAELQQGLQTLSSIFLISSNALADQQKYLPDSLLPKSEYSYDEHVKDKTDDQLKILRREFDHLLYDFNGTPRADFLAVPKDALELLRGVWNLSQDDNKVDRVAKRLVPVQSFFPNLLNYLLRTPGFPTASDVFDSDVFRTWGKKKVKQTEKVLKQLIRTSLEDMGYPCKGHEIDFYLSFMKTKLRTIVQDPHIDFKWESVDPWYVDESEAPRRKTKRGRKLDYKERVPFIAFFPLTSDGMAVEVWQAREDHGKGRDGVLVHIPFGTMMIARGDVVHAGGFSNSENGNPRCHLYIYRSGGDVHDINTSNTYTKEYDRKMVPMVQLYRHGLGI
eukprot:scaffold8374_cov175-Amphora_coffeaeformis.AAC.36